MNSKSVSKRSGSEPPSAAVGEYRKFHFTEDPVEHDTELKRLYESYEKYSHFYHIIFRRKKHYVLKRRSKVYVERRPVSTKVD